MLKHRAPLETLTSEALSVLQPSPQSPPRGGVPVSQPHVCSGVRSILLAAAALPALTMTNNME